MLVSTTKTIITKLLLGFIRIYQACYFLRRPCCRFEPSCSVYAYQAIEKYGIIKGINLALKRICKCHPWGAYGYDDV
jgi:putative membrane protein insertion efficiency factor